MEAVCKSEEDEMEAAVVNAAALDEWPPPATSTNVDISNDSRKDNASRLLFLVSNAYFNSIIFKNFFINF